MEHLESFHYNALNPKEEIPEIYFGLNNDIFPNGSKGMDDWTKAKAIGKWLRGNIKGGPGLGKSSSKAILAMINGKGGVCSDFSQVFNNFCVINDIKVREWGIRMITTQPNVRGGHTMNEIYSNELQKWILIDVAKSVYFVNKSTHIPISVIELLDLKANATNTLHTNLLEQSYTRELELVAPLYFSSQSVPFLITNYRNKSYDFFLDSLGFLPESIIHGMMYITGNCYSFEFPNHQANRN